MESYGRLVFDFYSKLVDFIIPRVITMINFIIIKNYYIILTFKGNICQINEKMLILID
jgi:hypothetical protein